MPISIKNPSSSSILDWSETKISQLLAAIIGAMALFIALFMGLLQLFDLPLEDSFDRQVLKQSLLVIFLVLCTSVVLYFLGSVGRYQQPRAARRYSAICMVFFALTVVIINYYLGEFGILMGVTMSSVIIVGWILFDFALVNVVFIFAMLLTVLSFTLKSYGFVSYAPLVPEGVSHSGNLSWVVAVTCIGVPQFFSPLIIAYISIKRWQERELQVKRQAMTDNLTKLYNRHTLIEKLEQAVALALKDKLPMAVLLLDLDFFKEINDAYGHLVGDEVLHKIATSLEAEVAGNGIIGRYGGEEFCAVLPNADMVRATQVATRCHQEVQKISFHSQGKQFNLTLSIGICAYLPGATDNLQLLCTELMRSADHALYAAKNNGRNCIHVSTLNGASTNQE